MGGGVARLVKEVEDNFMSHCSDTVINLAKRGSVTIEEYRKLRINSYEQKLLLPSLNNEALINHIEACSMQVRSLAKHQLPRHYEEFLATDAVELLLKRLKEVQRCLK